MAVFGQLAEIRKQLGDRSQLIAVFQYLEQAMITGGEINQRILDLKQDQYEKFELTDNIYAIEQSYNTRSVADSFFESHIKYIDMQFMVAGEELIAVADIDDLIQTADYDETHDYSKYSTKVAGSSVLLKAGTIAVFFPEDGHMPALMTETGSEKIYKTVVKVPVTLL